MPHKVLLITDDPGTGGVAQYNHALLCALAGRGDSVACLQSSADNPLVRGQADRGVRHHFLSFDTQKEFAKTLTNEDEPRAVLDTERPDLVVVSNGCPLSNLAAKKVALRSNVSVVVVEHFAAAYLADRAAEHLPELACQYAAARSVIAVSKANLQLLRERFGLPKDRGRVVHYGRPESFFAPRDPANRQRLRQRYEIPADAPVCLTAARLDPLKGHRHLLEAMRVLSQRAGPRIFFVWAGNGPSYRELFEKSQKHTSGRQLRMLGQTWDIHAWLDAADMFALPSHAEGMPLAIMEAMAKGLAVVASAVSGIPEELGETGQLLPDPEVDSRETVHVLAETLAAWAESPERRRHIGEAGRQRAMIHFREARMVTETLQILDDALKG